MENQIVLDKASRGEVFEQISQTIPSNEFGLPKFFYRCDLIPEDLYMLDEDEKNALLTSCQIQISYQEGFPTFKQSGNPLWHLMDNEDEEDHVLFKSYLDQMQVQGYRQLSLLPKDTSCGCPDINRVKELFVNYYWGTRAKAHDLFIAAAHRRMRDVRVMSCENYAMRKTMDILQRLDEKSEVIFSEEKLEALAPEDAVKMYKELMGIQHKVLGIGESNGRGKGDPNATPNASMEVTLRQVARDSGAILEAETQDNLHGSDDSGNIIRLLSGDPGTAGITQELVVRLNMGQKETKAPNGEANNKGQLSPNVNLTKDILGQPKSAKLPSPAPKRVAQADPNGTVTEVEVIKDDVAFVPIDDLDKDMMS